MLPGPAGFSLIRFLCVLTAVGRKNLHELIKYEILYLDHNTDSHDKSKHRNQYANGHYAFVNVAPTHNTLHKFSEIIYVIIVRYGGK